MTIFFTSDTHFGHLNIIKYCERPFSGVLEMDRELVERWNTAVRPEDIVYHLGDFAMINWRRYKQRLNGTIFLVPGDHDGRCFGDWLLPPIHTITYRKQVIVLCHYPMISWPKSHYGTWLLHGHSHGDNLPFRPGKMLNVCTELWDYRPISFDEVAEAMKSLPDNWNLIDKRRQQ